MLDVQLFDLHTFLPKPYEEALLPRLKKAHEELQTGTGLGGEFTGWVHLPQAYDPKRFSGVGGHRHRRQLSGSPRRDRLPVFSQL